jgi:hypothetical protein
VRTRLGVILVVLGIISLQSCGRSGIRTYPVTGTVTMAGQPIEKGSIVFDPADGRGTSAMGSIENGQFTAEVPAGEKIVRITAVRTTNEKDQYGEFITESYIPERHNTNSEIKRTVSANGENRFDLILD